MSEQPTATLTPYVRNHWQLACPNWNRTMRDSDGSHETVVEAAWWAFPRRHLAIQFAARRGIRIVEAA